MQVNLLVFDAPPQSFHEYIVPPATSAVHTDLDAVIFQQPSEFQASELASLVGVENVRLAITVDRLLYRLDTEVGGQRVG